MSQRRESGFAMLLVFLMASVIAINLYMQMPRAAFEAQRAREEMLQERGEQYIRAIQLYVAKWRRYPPDIDALEKTNNIRYLRKRYKDPMTGKDEWRAIHVNGAGQLTDSIVQKQPGEEKKQYNNTFISELPSVGATAGTGAEAQNIALRRRPSDQGQPLPGMPGAGPQDPQFMQNGIPGMPQGQPGQPQPGQPQPGQPGVPGQTDPNGQPLPPSIYGQPGEDGPPAVPPGQQPNPNYQPGQFNPNFPPDQQPNPSGRPVQPGQPNPNFPPGQQPNPYGPPVQPGQQAPQPGQPQTPNYGMPYPVPAPPGAAAGNPGAAPAPQGAQQPGAPGANQGLDMINKILTTPRGGMNMAIPGAQGLQIGGGIAGFASLAESPSIKVYNERQKYNEWEFVYDMKKDKRLLGAAAGMAPNQPNNPLGNTQNNPLGGVPNPLTGNPPNTPQSNAPGNSFGQNPFGGQNSGGFNQRGNQPTTPNTGFSQPRTR